MSDGRAGACVSPVLVVAFRRPALTAAVFRQLARVRPPAVFFAVDGPRSERAGEAEAVAAVRACARLIDWPCRVETLFRDENLGVQRGVSTAVDWFFEHVEAGIILEDDLVTSPGFFRFCDELLARYTHDERVGVITGDNFQYGRTRGPASYYFSCFPHCWGWATWRRAWRKRDIELADLSDADDVLARLFTSSVDRLYWKDTLTRVRKKTLDSWAFPWSYSCFRHGMLTATPQANIVENVGLGEDASHTAGSLVPAIQSLSFPLVHPHDVVRDDAADALVQRREYRHDVTRAERVVRGLRRRGRVLLGALETLRAR